MRRQFISGFTLAFLLLFPIFSVDSYASEPRISVDPQLTKAFVGSDIVVAVRIRDVTDLIGWQVALKYNGSILDLTAVWYPEDHVFAGQSGFIPVEPMINDTLDGNKYVLHGAALLLSSVDVVEGVLFKMNFTVMESGETPLFIGTEGNPIKWGVLPWHVWYSFLLDSNNEKIPFTEEHGVVYIGGSFVVLTVEATQGGITDPEIGVHPYSINATVPVSAVPIPGYDFSYWELDSVYAGSENPRVVFMTSNHTLKAVFTVHPPRTWIVDDDGPADFHTIQEAVESLNVTHGDSIFVKSGVYYEHLYVSKNLTIIGEDKGTTVIDGNGTGVVVRAEAVANWVPGEYVYHPSGLKVLRGFTIRNGEYGLQITSRVDAPLPHPVSVVSCVVDDNRIVDNRYGGIALGGSDLPDCRLITVSNNFIANNTLFGIHFRSSTNNTVVNNTVVNNGHGIHLYDSSDNILRENRMSNNTYNFGFLIRGGLPQLFVWMGINHVDSSNIVNGKPVYWWIDRHDAQIPSNAGYIFLYNCTNITIEGCSLTNNLQGITLLMTNDTSILNTHIANNVQGILIALWSSRNTLTGNTLANNTNGIYLGDSSRHTTMRNNTINNSHLSFGIYPQAPYPWSYEELQKGFDLEESDLANDIDDSNTIDGKPIIYWINQHNRQVPENAGYVMLINSTNILVKDLDLSNNVQCINVYGSNNTVITNNLIASSIYGVQVNNVGWREWRQTCFNVTVEGNTIIHNGVGVLFGSITNSSVSDNAFYGNRLGIHFRRTDNSSISRNIITKSDLHYNQPTPHPHDLLHYPEEPQEWAMELNQIDGGIVVGGDYNTIWGNTIRSCTNGIVMYDVTQSFLGCIYNVIFSNNLINNKHLQAWGILASTSTKWDNGYPAGGNYWSDYNGVDIYSGPYQNETGSDNIGDKSYTIIFSGGPILIEVPDRYPLMNPWVLPDVVRADIDGNGEVDMKDISTAATAFGSWPGHSRWNRLVDVVGDNIIDLRDVATICRNFGQISAV